MGRYRVIVVNRHGHASTALETDNRRRAEGKFRLHSAKTSAKMDQSKAVFLEDTETDQTLSSWHRPEEKELYEE